MSNMDELLDRMSNCKKRSTQVSNMVEVEVKLIKNTDRALLISDGDIEVWVPTSLIGEDSDGLKYAGDTGVIMLPEWLAVDKELV